MDSSITTDYAGFKKEKEKNEMPNFCCWFCYPGKCLGCLYRSYATDINITPSYVIHDMRIKAVY